MRYTASKIFALILLSLLSLSCQEDFSPKTNFKEQYVLNCYIDLDYGSYMHSFVYATVSKLYNVDGLDPSQNKINPSVSGASIYLSYRGDLYGLDQDTIKTSTSKYDTIQVYYKTMLKYLYPNYSVSLYAKMPDGTVLTAKTQLLEALQLGFSYNFTKGFTTKINRFLFGNVFTINWGYTEGRLLFPQMLIPYRRTDGGYTVYYKEVPIKYINNNGRYELLYPSPTSSDSISYDYSAIDSAMAQTAASENFSYFIGNIIFQMVEMDEPLSKYYESIHGNIDSYSISLDQFVYSNISGGIGIFGSKRTISNYWDLDPRYIATFIP